MSSRFLQEEPFNAIIVGGGAIGSALADTLLARSQLAQLVILQRRSATGHADPRVRIMEFDAERPESLSAAAASVSQSMQRVHCMINTVGILHDKEQQPEKRLQDVDPENLQRSFLINATLLPALARAFGKLLRHEQPAVLASLSARVGSIADNHLGGWYSYRASKAAHNMLLRTIAQEWRVSHPNAAVVALHPGTVHSPLSAPFIPASYRNPVLTPQESAEALLGVISTLPEQGSGKFYDWQGKTIPW